MVATSTFHMHYSVVDQLLTVDLEGLVTEEDNLFLLHEVAEQMNQTDAVRLLINAQGSKTTPAEAIKWASEHYLNLLANGLTMPRQLKIARVESVEMCWHLQQLIIEKVRTAFAASVELCFFHNLSSARYWLSCT